MQGVRSSSENSQAYTRKGLEYPKFWDIIEICCIAITDKSWFDFSYVCKQKTVKQVLKPIESILQQ